MASVSPNAPPAPEMCATRITADEPSEPRPAGSGRPPYGPGDHIDGRYELESLLGRGGMGEVWTARNATLDVRRAVKLIRADAMSPESTDRLLHEAQAAARLTEPGIVRVYDFGKTAAGDPYIVMEMLEGEDLMSIIQRRERLSPTKAVRVLLPVIRALVTAHANGIVHRDLKPENIFLATLPDGRVQPKLLDFGIAKLKSAQALRLTTAGAILGSPLYMAPEQARGEDVDERADVWALCVVLYEAIAGTPPFCGDDRAEVMRAAAASSPPPLSHHGVEDTSLWPLLCRGLEKRREDRWSSMEELGRSLARWLLDAGVTDDVTGASLQASWLRTSRQSLFASSAPPRRRSQAAPEVALLELGRARRLRRAAYATALARLDWGRARLRALRLPASRARLGLAAVALAALALTWLVLGGPAPAVRGEPLAAPAAPVRAAEAAVPAPEILPATQSSPPRAPAAEAAAAPASQPAEAATKAALAPPTHASPRAPRRAPRAAPVERPAPSDSLRDRRSKLIDPYR